MHVVTRPEVEDRRDPFYFTGITVRTGRLEAMLTQVEIVDSNGCFAAGLITVIEGVILAVQGYLRAGTTIDSNRNRIVVLLRKSWQH